MAKIESEELGGQAVPEIQESTSLSTAELAALRVQRIMDLQISALHHADPLRAVLGASTATLCLLTIPVEQAVVQHVSASQQTAESLNQALPGMELVLRFHRQIERNVQVEQRLVAAELAQCRA